MVKVGAPNANGGLGERAVTNWSKSKETHSDLVHTYFGAFPFAGATAGVTGGVTFVFSLSPLPLSSLPEMSSSSITHSACCFGILRLLINFETSLAKFDSWSR